MKDPSQSSDPARPESGALPGASIDAKELFNQALAIANPVERSEFVARACAGRPDAEELVRSLLEAHEEAGNFLGATQIDGEAAAGITEGPGTVIERYKLLQVIGEGGFGIVYMAEQSEPIHRKVALKIIKAGMDTKQVVARFEAERQALALMDHPNIAHVLDAGSTETGRPYFVMELVRGVPITKYCDQHHLSTADRLELFIQVCHAIQHAHQKGIIHRDLKPSNILVTLHDSVPVPKVIDFGVAKAIDQRLTEKTLFTRYEQMIGTPAYMSPEQAEMSGLDIDTRSDVYALGVLLYELLTGTTPFDAETLRHAAFDEMRRIIREDEPPKPSTRVQTLGETASQTASNRSVSPGDLRRDLDGDLDWIVMKAMEKDRVRRYETANGLALDIERHLASEPVSASPPGALYRFKKFARRRKGLAAAAAAITLSLVAGTLISTWQAILASHNANVAREKENEALRFGKEASENAAAAQEARAAANKASTTLRQTLVRADLAAANEAFESGDSSIALAHLARALRTDPAYQPAAIRLVNALTNRSFPLEAPTVLEHARFVDQVLFTDGGALTVTIDQENRLRVWETATGKLVQDLDPPFEVSFWLVSRAVACGVAYSKEGILTAWNLRDGQQLGGPLLGGEGAHGAWLGRNRRLLPSGTASETLIMSVQEGGSFLYVFAMPSKTGTPFGEPFARIENFTYTRFSGDGSALIGAIGRQLGRPDDRIEVYDLAEQKLRATLKVPAGENALVELSSTGRTLLHIAADRRAVTCFPVTGAESRRPISFTLSEPARTIFNQGGASQEQNLFGFSHDDSRFFSIYPPTEPGGELHAEIFNLESGERTAEIRQPDVALLDEVLGPGFDHGFFGAAATNGMIRFWNLDSGALISTIPRQDSPLDFFWLSPDCRSVLTTCKNSNIRLWDLATGNPLIPVLRHADDGSVPRALFSPDSLRLFTSAADKALRGWDSFSGQPLREADPLTTYVSSRSFTPDGRHLGLIEALFLTSPDKVRSQAVGQARLVDTVSRAARPLARIHPTESRDGRIPVLADGRIVQDVPVEDSEGHIVALQRWDLADGRLLREVRCETPLLREPVGPNFSVETFRMVGLTDNRQVVLVDGDTGKTLWSARHDSPVRFVTHNRKDSRVVITSAEDRVLRVWDTREDRLLGTLPSDAYVAGESGGMIYLSPSGAFLAVDDNNTGIVRIWNTSTMKETIPPQAIGHDKLGGQVEEISFSPDERRIAIACRSGTAQVVDLSSGLVQAIDHGDYCRRVSFSDDGRFLATAGAGNKEAPQPVKAWNLATGRQIGKTIELAGFIREISFLSSSQLLAATSEQIFKVWDLNTGALIADPVPLQSWAKLVPEASLVVEGGEITPIPDGKLASGGAQSHTSLRFTIHPLLLPVQISPAWLPEVAEAVAGLRLNEEGVPEPVERTQLADLRLSTKSSSRNSSGFWESWRAWFFADPVARSIHPSLETKQNEAIAALLQGDRDDLREVLRRDPSNVTALARLARLDLEAPLEGSERLPDPARWESSAGVCARRALELDANSPEAWRTWALVTLVQRDLEECSPALDRANRLELVPQPDTILIRSLLAALGGDPREAARLFELASARALEIDGNQLPGLRSPLLRQIRDHGSRDPEQWLAMADSRLKADPMSFPLATIEALALASTVSTEAPENENAHALFAEAMIRVGGGIPGDANPLAALASETGDSPALLRLRGVLAESKGDTEAALTCYRAAADLAANQERRNPAEFTRSLEAAARILSSQGHEEEAEQARFRAQISIPAPETTQAQIDLTTFYNATLTEDWTNPDHKGSNYSRLPKGFVTLPGRADLHFDLRGIVQLKSRQVQRQDRYPESITGIPIHQRAHWLHFLNGAAWGDVQFGEKVATLRVQYTGREEPVEFPIVNGYNTGDWWTVSIKEAPSESSVIWSGTAPIGSPIRLLDTLWENPLPDLEISHIDLISEMKHPAFFVIAITAELDPDRDRKLGRWPQAWARYQQTGEDRSEDPLYAGDAMLAAWLAGDHEAARRIGKRLVEQFADESDAEQLHHALYHLLALPTVEEWFTPQEKEIIAAMGKRTPANDASGHRWWGTLTAARACLRTGNPQKARALMEPLLAEDSGWIPPQAKVNYALAAILLGDTEAARVQLEKARATVEQELSDGMLADDASWRDTVIPALLVMETDRLLGKKEIRNYLDPEALAQARGNPLARELQNRWQFLIRNSLWEEAAETGEQFERLPGFTWAAAHSAYESLSYAMALATLKSGKIDQYRRMAIALIQVLPRLDDPRDIELALIVILLGAPHLEDVPWQTMLEAADRCLEVAPEGSTPHRYTEWCRAAIPVYAGRADQNTIASLERLVSSDWFIRILARSSLAIAHAQSGDLGKARRSLSVAHFEANQIVGGDWGFKSNKLLATLILDQAVAKVGPPASTPQRILEPGNGLWRHYCPTSEEDTTEAKPRLHESFMTREFNDREWASDRDQRGGFGFGEDVPVRWIPPPKGERHSAYLRRTFRTDRTYQNLLLKLLRDDGIVVYLDGKEVGRDNMTDGPTSYTSAARAEIYGGVERLPVCVPLDGTLEPGEHVLAISLHNAKPDSSDLRIGDITLLGEVVEE